MSTLDSPTQNHLLAALHADVREHLLPHLELMEMPLGWVVFESGRPQHYAYFPTTAIVSQLCLMENGASAEVAITGNEGMVGVTLLLGGESTSWRAVVQSAGQGYRIPINKLKSEFAKGGQFQRAALRFAQALMTQMAQTAACNRHHGIEQQLCRWLLLSMDRLPGRVLNMTQELIGNMLGVRREGVTDAAGKLQEDGLISYSRGHIKILDRPGIERRACECYAIVRKELDRLLPYESPTETRART